jgi:phosphoglycerol transferase MdoB-like AlkP superfamily enzyme
MSEIVETQSFAKYAGAAVFAPMIFTIPFPTMVETEGQETSRMLHGGMVTKGIMSFFCVLAIISLLFKVIPGKNNWRQHILIGGFLLAYLGILVFSAFAHADRFHMPALPLEILFVAYGLSLWRVKIFQRWYNWWLILMVVAFIAWNWFKLSGRGLV